MTFQAKLDVALQMLAATGMRRSNYAPPLYRLLWRTGIPIPPPPFAGFGINLAFFGILFGVLYGFAMWFLVWRRQGMSAGGALVGAMVAGLLFGAVMAGYWVYKARKLKLPRWADLESPAATFD